MANAGEVREELEAKMVTLRDELTAVGVEAQKLLETVRKEYEAKVRLHFPRLILVIKARGRP